MKERCVICNHAGPLIASYDGRLVCRAGRGCWNRRQRLVNISLGRDINDEVKS